jgi:hypothetical protein
MSVRARPAGALATAPAPRLRGTGSSIEQARALGALAERGRGLPQTSTQRRPRTALAAATDGSEVPVSWSL